MYYDNWWKDSTFRPAFDSIDIIEVEMNIAYVYTIDVQCRQRVYDCQRLGVLLI